MYERLLVVAHGTASAAGIATTAHLIDAIAAARRTTEVGLCFLDVASPRLPDALDARPAVIMPLLLSTGYHVQTDIPAAVAAHPQVRVTRHLGPHPLLVDALLDRIVALPGTGSTFLVGAGSSRPEAAAELTETGRLLADRLGCEVTTATMTDDLPARFAAATQPVRIATYLLATGQFHTSLRAAAAGFGSVADPIGVHPALVELVWTRYDESRDGLR